MFKGQERLRRVACIAAAVLIAEAEAVSHLVSEPWAGLFSAAVVSVTLLLTLLRSP
jgi:hypothetical protein